jgi:hypothetical protein
MATGNIEFILDDIDMEDIEQDELGIPSSGIPSDYEDKAGLFSAIIEYLPEYLEDNGMSKRQADSATATLKKSLSVNIEVDADAPEPITEMRFSPAADGPVEDIVGWEHKGSPSVTFSVNDVDAVTQLDMGLSELVDYLSISITDAAALANVKEVKVSPELEVPLLAIENELKQKTEKGFIIVPADNSVLPNAELAKSLPPLPEITNVAISTAEGSTHWPVYQNDPKVFIDDSKWKSMTVSDYRASLGNDVLAVYNPRAEDLNVFPNPSVRINVSHPAYSAVGVAVQAKQIADAVNQFSDNPNIMSMAAHNIAATTPDPALRLNIAAEAAKNISTPNKRSGNTDFNDVLTNQLLDGVKENPIDGLVSAMTKLSEHKNEADIVTVYSRKQIDSDDNNTSLSHAPKKP